MLTREAVTSGLTLLCAAFRVQLTPDMVSAFHLALKDRLTQAQWVARVKDALTTRTANFWPPPGWFLEDPDRAATEELEALAVFRTITDKCYEYFGASCRLYRINKVLEAGGAAAWEVFQAIGGGRAVNDADAEGLRFLARDFARLYPAARRKELASAASDKQAEGRLRGAGIPYRQLRAAAPGGGESLRDSPVPTADGAGSVRRVNSVPGSGGATR